MKRHLYLFLFLLSVILFSTKLSAQVFAAGSCSIASGHTGCSSDMECNDPAKGQGECNQRSATSCGCDFNIIIAPGDSNSTNPFGQVTPPFDKGIFAGSTNGSGLLVLARAVLALVFTAAGIYAFIRVLLAGLKFMSAGGDSKTIQAAWDSIWQALLGMVIVISSLVIAALIGMILFGNATAILIPQIYKP